MDFGDFTITKREIMVSIIIIFVLITIGFFIANSIENEIEEKNEKYYKSLKIDNNVDQFKYAINTNIGYTFAKGDVVCELIAVLNEETNDVNQEEMEKTIDAIIVTLRDDR